jgi:hypothetical protein
MRSPIILRRQTLRKFSCAVAFTCAAALCPSLGAQATDLHISNGILSATIHPPDPANGFYRGTRFDWSGVLGSLRFAGHDYYGPWFNKTDATVHDFIFRGQDIIAGPASAITGPVEEFSTHEEGLGFAEAKAGGTFLKIGVGVLRKPDDAKYDMFRSYEIVDHGKWTVQATATSVVFTQRVMDPQSGYGYLYEKTVRLVPGKPEMLIEHRLTNTGKRPIESSVYDHNFLVLDHQTTGPDFAVTVPFTIHPAKPYRTDLGKVEGNKISYVKKLEGRDIFGVAIAGFGKTASDYKISIENRKLGVGMKISGDQPLESEELWSIRTILAMEPFIHMSIAPGHSFQWKYTYDYYTLPGKEQ